MGLDRKLQYHSMTGCCICGTKTSSSRFTSSARFESLFEPCFGITYSNQCSGDICNACVLIVKRFRNSPRDSCKNWAHIIGSKVGPGHRSARRQKAVKHEGTVRPKSSKPVSRSAAIVPNCGKRTPSPMCLRHPKRFTIKAEPVKEKKLSTATSTKYRAVTPLGCGRRPKVFRQRPVRRLHSSAASNNVLIDTDYWKRMTVCCGAVYKSESHDLILIDVAKFRPCRQQHHCSLAYFTTATRDTEITDSDNCMVISASHNSTNSQSTQDNESVRFYNHEQGKEVDCSSSLPSSLASADVEHDDEDGDSYSALQTDESMDAASDSDSETLHADTGPTILCNLLWNSGHGRSFGKAGDLGNRSDFVWSKIQPPAVNVWPSTHALSKPSPVKVYP